LRGELNRRYPHVRFIAEHAGADIPWRDIGLLCITASDARAFQRALAAMAHGVPVVAFSTPSLASLIRPGEGGWLVNPGNLAAMARIIDRWETLDETARRALSDGARRLVAEHFSPNRTLSTVLAVYARAVG
jgi:glycosyltransferase involved in cell wall biosynthesis